MTLEEQLASYYPHLVGEGFEPGPARDAAQARAKEQIILAMFPSIPEHVGSFLKSPEGFRYQYLREDLESHASAQLVEAVDRLSRGIQTSQPDKLVQYLTRMLVMVIREYAREDSTVRVPRKTMERHLFTEGVVPVTTIPLDAIVKEPTYESPEGVIDLWDSILALCESERERFIVVKKVEGYTTAEIAEELELHPKTVSKMLKALRVRVMAEITED